MSEAAGDDEVLRSSVVRAQVRAIMDDHAARVTAGGLRRLLTTDEEGQPVSRGRILPRELRDAACEMLGVLGLPVVVEALVSPTVLMPTKLQAVNVLVGLGPGFKSGKSDEDDDGEVLPGVVELPIAMERPTPPEGLDDGKPPVPVSDGATRAARLREAMQRQRQLKGGIPDPSRPGSFR